MTTRITFAPAHMHEAVNAYAEGSLGQDTETAANMPTSRVYGEALHHDLGSPQSAPRESITSRHIMSFEGVAGGSVMATLQRQGAHQTVELIPGQPSSRTHLAVALREGVITETFPGRYEDAAALSNREGGTRPAAPAQAQQPDQEAQAGEHFDASAEAEWAQTIDPIPQHVYDRAVSSVISATLNSSTDLDSTAKALAESLQLEPAQAQAMVDQGVQMYEKVVARSVAQMGIHESQKEAFYAFTRSRPHQLQDAIQRLTMGRDAKGFDAMAAEWLRHNGTSGRGL